MFPSWFLSGRCPSSPLGLSLPPSLLVRALTIGGLLVVASAFPEDLAGADAIPNWDRDGDGIEDLLQEWRAGKGSWDDLRRTSLGSADLQPQALEPGLPLPVSGPMSRGHLRLLSLGAGGPSPELMDRLARQNGGVCIALHQLDRFGGVVVWEVDPIGLAGLLDAGGFEKVLLDRDGRPALDESRRQVGGDLAAEGPWQLTGGWTASVAILDSGCDTAHEDLGDPGNDNHDGPPPAVGDALDWFSAAIGWQVFSQYKVIGWHDVTDDFPGAVGPWDYHFHGTALAGVVAGAGEVDPLLRGVAAGGRMTIVKFYDFDQVWRQWAGDFLAACDWVLANHETYRIRVVLAAVNWDVDAGITTAMDALLEAGLVTVVAAGNHGEQTLEWGYPAAVPGVLTVGSVTDLSAVAATSGRGPRNSRKPDLMAPGGGLLTDSGRITTTDNEPDDTYSPRSGTSLAAAHVAAGAFLLCEAWRTEGLSTPANRQEAVLAGSLLKATAAPVFRAETPDGLATVPLPAVSAPDSVRGWGMLQVHAAVEACLAPLEHGESVSDSLGGFSGREVLARRLVVHADDPARIVAAPTGDLDVRLEIHNSRWLVDPNWGLEPIRVDDGGPGFAERGSARLGPEGFSFAVVKRISGYGRVTLSLEGADTAPQFFQAGLGGQVTGWPNSGLVGSTLEPSLVVTSLSDLFSLARQVHLLDPSGRQPPGWPAVMFIPSSFHGNLSAPLVWDLDDQPGDEIVVASDFGRVYFLEPEGSFTTLNVAPANVALTAPVGVEGSSGTRLAVVVDAEGQVYRLAAPAQLLDSLPLDRTDPRPPAVGQLDADPNEEIVIAFAAGQVFALDASGSSQPGWPRDLDPAADQVLAPVLGDFDVDGQHEIVVPVVTTASDLLFHVWYGDGAPHPLNGTVLPAPDGGRWEDVADPALLAGALGPESVTTIGLVSQGTGVDSKWALASASLNAASGPIAQSLPGFAVSLATNEGLLNLRWSRLVAPLAWNSTGDSKTDPSYLVSLGWSENVASVPDLLGAATALFRSLPGHPVEVRSNLKIGGSQATNPGPLAGAVWATPIRDLLVTCLEKTCSASPLPSLPAGAFAWRSIRADQRNSGAHPLGGGPPTEVGSLPTVVSDLAILPNPGTNRFAIRWQGVPAGPADLEVFDLRGRRLRRLHVPDGAKHQELHWDGRDGEGRPVAAGPYLFLLRHPGGRLSGRAVVTR